MPRKIALWLHRYSGLAMALFLAVAGLSGSVLAFGDEIDEWLNRDLLRVPAAAMAYSSVQLAQSLEATDPRVRVRDLPLNSEDGEALVLGVMPRIDPATGRPYRLDFTQVFVDPATGAIVGRRSTAPGLDRRRIVATLHALHASLLMGPPGRVFLGSVAIIWAINCCLGLWLTLPPRLAVWKISINRGMTRLLLDLHRAGALWTWVFLLMLAVSSIHLGLYQQVFRPLVGLFSPLTPSLAEQGQARLRAAPREPQLGFADAIAKAEGDGAILGRHLLPSRARLLPNYGVYLVSFTPDGADDAPGLGATRIFIDDSDGSVVARYVPGVGSSGDVFLQMQFPVHSGEVAGLPGRAVICVMGLVVATLSISGVLLWWRKRRRPDVTINKELLDADERPTATA